MGMILASSEINWVISELEWKGTTGWVQYNGQGQDTINILLKLFFPSFSISVNDNFILYISQAEKLVVTLYTCLSLTPQCWSIFKYQWLFLKISIPSSTPFITTSWVQTSIVSAWVTAITLYWVSLLSPFSPTSSLPGSEYIFKM